MNYLETPAYKLEVKDVQKAQEVNVNPNTGKGEWTLTLHSKDLTLNRSSSTSTSPPKDPLPPKEVTLNLSVVWMQGTVIEKVEPQPPNLSFLRFSDGTGEATVHDYHNLPGADSSITKGTYIGVIGQIARNKPAVIIKGAKIMNLQHSVPIQSLWSEEIVMDRAFLLGLIEPDINGS